MLHYPSGSGAVFSIESICWTSSVPLDDADSKITKNLRRRNQVLKKLYLKTSRLPFRLDVTSAFAIARWM